MNVLTVVNVPRFTALFTVTRYKKSQKTDIPEKTQTPLTFRSLTDLIASFFFNLFVTLVCVFAVYCTSPYSTRMTWINCNARFVVCEDVKMVLRCWYREPAEIQCIILKKKKGKRRRREIDCITVTVFCGVPLNWSCRLYMYHHPFYIKQCSIQIEADNKCLVWLFRFTPSEACWDFFSISKKLSNKINV